MYDETGLLREILSKYRGEEKVDRKIAREYDALGRLVSSETEGKVTKYAYDAAGRLVKEGNKSYTYAWLDKLVSVSEAGKVSANFSYHFDGQIAGVTYADGAVRRPAVEAGTLREPVPQTPGGLPVPYDGTELLNEPAVTGGNPVLSGDKVLFNDMLGNTLGVKGKDAYQPIKMTAFGESDNVDAFFTGKPLVGELGYAFLFRNYRPEQGKWQTADPLGYPDGWNNFAYVNNEVTSAIDRFGTDIYHVYDSDSSWHGHSASIIGNPQDGYKAYNFGGAGGGYTMGDQNDKTYATAQEALAALNKGREGIYEYDKVQKWDTTPEQDKKAQDANKAHIDAGGYGEILNNCTDAVEAALDAADVKHSTGVMPKTLFDNNKNNATTLNYNDFKNGIIE